MAAVVQEKQIKTAAAALIITIVAALLLFIGLLGYVGIEGYFFPYPAIDTRFTADYSEDGFQQIEVGMSQQEVLDLIGTPHNSTSHPSWVYSEDNAFPLWDFAWLMRSVTFDEEGKVTLISASVAYD